MQYNNAPLRKKQGGLRLPYKDIVQRYIFTPNRRTAVLAVLVAVGIGIVFLIVQRQPPAEWHSATAAGLDLPDRLYPRPRCSIRRLGGVAGRRVGPLPGGDQGCRDSQVTGIEGL
ncbi:MAG: hypothetical protein KAR37_06885 [Alphaproteobacteria bacterium]|nr:hypothetical protein [Alphaproteobacteria bacterium]